MRGFRSKIVVVLAGVVLAAGCAQPGAAPAVGSTWEPGVAAQPSPPEPETSAPTRSPVATPEPTKTKIKAKIQPAKTPHFSGPAGSRMTTGGSAIALTFDDGPDPVQTPRILDLLAEHHVKATFCLVGQNVVAHPDLVRRIVAEGHTLCNHTWRHSLTLGRQSPAAIRTDLQRTDDAIRAAAPGAKVEYLRAPGGNFTPAFVRVASELGMTSIYWQVDPRDWDHPAGETSAAHRARVIAAVEKHAHPGAIVLSHDYGQPDTIAAYRILIPWLKARYRLTAMPTPLSTTAG
jgi:peptidoglycan/xylan/chitin deacetylase (PgdA/CDA1 family)